MTIAIPTFVKAGNEEGFTLLELLVTLAIVALVAALAFPGIQATARSQNAETISREIVSRLRVSRTIAIARASPQSVVIAPGARQIRFPDDFMLSLPQESRTDDRDRPRNSSRRIRSCTRISSKWQRNGC
ncbi:prepilin-type N-terminal cleavage/methylation domain-containing protein (plasmid) [Aminobacter sp. BA135]|uniref:prepilin-type N-terminal cleavage/methylation domain-containing protein n=1 Tax=Aminobacter sp. BA135 TaxID=537596 RepID=UPI003D7BBD32